MVTTLGHLEPVNRKFAQLRVRNIEINDEKNGGLVEFILLPNNNEKVFKIKAVGDSDILWIIIGALSYVGGFWSITLLIFKKS